MPRRPAGFPGGAHKCVHRRRPAEAHALLEQAQPPGRTRGPRPPPPSRMNGSWLWYGPKHLLAPSRSLAPATRCGRLSAPVLLGRTTERWRKERLPCHRPSKHSRAPTSARVLRSPCRERPVANDAATPSPEPRGAAVPSDPRDEPPDRPFRDERATRVASVKPSAPRRSVPSCPARAFAGPTFTTSRSAPDGSSSDTSVVVG